MNTPNPEPIPRKQPRRPQRLRANVVELTVDQILQWADAFHDRHGRWPRCTDGKVEGTLQERWATLNRALTVGSRGLEPGSSLARLFAEKRGHRNAKALPPYTEEQILAWADAHFARTGRWPHVKEGDIVDAPGETWNAVDRALISGKRGLPGGSSLWKLLSARLGVRNQNSPPSLTNATILHWADAHYARTGDWPTKDSGEIPEAPGEAWSAVAVALYAGTRGLPGGMTLTNLLFQERGRRHPMQPPNLLLKQIQVWAQLHFDRTGRWPTTRSGPVVDAPGEHWKTIDEAFRNGKRGLKGGMTLSRYLNQTVRKAP